MNTLGKIFVGILCLVVAGCGLINPYEKWENEGQHSADRLLPSELKATLCSQDWWKTTIEGNDFYFRFEEEGTVTSSSTMNEAAVNTSYHFNWTDDKAVIIMFDDDTHLSKLPEDSKEKNLVVTAFDSNMIVAKGDQHRTEITLEPADEEEYEAMESRKLNYILVVEKPAYIIGQASGELRVKITGGDWSVKEPSQDWLTFERRDGNHAVFSYTEASHRFRVQEVEVTQLDPGGNELSSKFVVSGTNVLNFTQTYAEADFKGNETVKAINELTYEALICPTDFQNTINTVMGVEGKFLVRLGDSGYPKDQVQVAFTGGKVAPGDAAVISKNEWTHLAVTMNATDEKITVYINGENVFSVSNNVEVNISDFKIGRSGTYTNRFFTGYMAEVRVWTKALTEEEINAENHFYAVDPKSDGLFAYWKCDDGQGSTLVDATGHGYDCTGAWANELVWETMPLTFPLPE